MTRRLMMCSVLLLLSGMALAQQGLNSPVFYYSTSPVLELGALLHGQLDPDDGRNFKDGSYLDVFVFWGVEGEATEITASSHEIDVYLTLYGPGGTLIDSNDDDWAASEWTTDAAIRLDLPSTGTYVVVVSGYSEYDLGAYTVRRDSYVVPTGTTVSVTGPGNYVGTLSSAVRDHYLLELTQTIDLIATLRSEEFDAYLEILDASGVVVAYNDDFEAAGFDAQLVLELAPGQYVIVVSSYYDGGRGGYGLDLDW